MHQQQVGQLGLGRVAGFEVQAVLRLQGLDDRGQPFRALRMGGAGAVVEHVLMGVEADHAAILTDP